MVLVTDAVSRFDARGVAEMRAIGVVPLGTRAVCAALMGTVVVVP